MKLTVNLYLKCNSDFNAKTAPIKLDGTVKIRNPKRDSAITFSGKTSNIENKEINVASLVPHPLIVIGINPTIDPIGKSVIK